MDWPHLIAQTISFGIVCAALYLLAYKPILRMLAARREQIASGLANAAQIEAQLATHRGGAPEVIGGGGGAMADCSSRRARSPASAEHETQEAIAAAQQIEASARDAAERERTRMIAEPGATWADW